MVMYLLSEPLTAMPTTIPAIAPELSLLETVPWLLVSNNMLGSVYFST
jgi:hypothetical protein